MKRFVVVPLFLISAVPSVLHAIPSPACLSLYKHAATQKEIVYLFAHGLRANQEQGLELFSNHYNKRWIIQQPFVLFDFPDAHPKKGHCRDKHVSLGQQEDVERMKRAYDYANKKMPDSEGMVLTGISRGAVTCLNFVATYQPAKIRALVVESPFDTLKTVIKHLLKGYKLKWIPYSTSMGMSIADTKFGSLNPEGLFPIDLVRHIPHDIPILLIGTRHDDVIPIKSIRALYDELRRCGHEDVYFLELTSGKHGSLTKSNQSNRYINCVHAFYQLYGLPHDKDFAQDGQAILAKCQPE